MCDYYDAEMRVVGQGFVTHFVLLGGCLLPSLFLCPETLADNVFLKNGKEVKGLVVEKHSDRVILSTAEGEIPILLKGIEKIEYDDPEQSFVDMAVAYEKAGKFGEALAYYEKALEINPELQEAKKAVAGVRNRFLAITTEGPRDEVEKQQMLHDAWKEGRSVDELIKNQRVQWTRTLREGLGVTLAKKDDWVRLEYVDPKKSAWFSGLKKNDRLVSIDGQSLRYLGVDAVTKYLLIPRFSNFTLEFERDCFLKQQEGRTELKDLGFKLKLKYEGIIVHSVQEDGSAALAGIRDEDLLTFVDSVPTRYTPLKDVIKRIQDSTGDRIVFTVRRSVLMVRR